MQRNTNKSSTQQFFPFSPPLSPAYPGYDPKRSALFDDSVGEHRRNVHANEAVAESNSQVKARRVCNMQTRLQTQLQSAYKKADGNGENGKVQLKPLSFEGDDCDHPMADRSHPLDALLFDEEEQEKKAGQEGGIKLSNANIIPDALNTQPGAKFVNFAGWGTIDCINLTYATVGGHCDSIQNFVRNHPAFNGLHQGVRPFDAKDLAVVSLLLQKPNLPLKAEEIASHAGIQANDVENRIAMADNLFSSLGFKGIMSAPNGSFGMHIQLMNYT